MTIVITLLLAAVIYLSLGLVFSIAFVFKGVDKIDEGAKNAGWGFRIIILPGVVILWPVMLRKCMSSIKQIKS